MDFASLPDQAKLRQFLDYEPETGALYWRARTPADFQQADCANCACKRWNARYAGKEAFTKTEKATGYRRGSFDNQQFVAHRLIWKWVHGVDPDTVDHINGVRFDNRLANLRSVPMSANMKNLCLRKDNVSGHHGIRFNARLRKWGVQISDINGKVIWLGHFAAIEDAVAARQQAERQNGYHDNHGRSPR